MHLHDWRPNAWVVAYLRHWLAESKQYLHFFTWATDACGYEQHMRFVAWYNLEGADLSHVEAYAIYADKLERGEIPEYMLATEGNDTVQNSKTPRPEQTWESVIQRATGQQAATRHDHHELVLHKAGDAVTVVFRGEPHAFEAIRDSMGWVLFDPTRHKDIDPELRILINVVIVGHNDCAVTADVVYVAYWEMGTDSFKQLAQLRNLYDLGRWQFKIIRLDNDNSEDPAYKIEPSGAIHAELQARLEGLPMIGLAHMRGSEDVGNAEED